MNVFASRISPLWPLLFPVIMARPKNLRRDASDEEDDKDVFDDDISEGWRGLSRLALLCTILQELCPFLVHFVATRSTDDNSGGSWLHACRTKQRLILRSELRTRELMLLSRSH